MDAWYTMDMKYTVSEFRGNLRKAFNEATTGIVEIERYGEIFLLKKLDSKSEVKPKFEVTPGEQKLSKEELQPLKLPDKPKNGRIGETEIQNRYA
jgi:hypothetical protein